MDADGNSARSLLVIGEETAQWRIAHGYTQETFAQAVGVSFEKVKRLEQGHGIMELTDAYKLSAFMGVDIEFFITSEVEKQATHKGQNSMTNRVNHFVRRLRSWCDNSPNCREKEEDMDTLERVMNTIDRSRKNYK